MGIDIYARWDSQTDGEREKQSSAWLSAWDGENGYLREAYHGTPYATMFLFLEAFESGNARIPAATLRERLPRTLAIVEERERTIYKSSDEDIERTKQSFRDFVALCECVEKQTGKPVIVVASF